MNFEKILYLLAALVACFVAEAIPEKREITEFAGLSEVAYPTAIPAAANEGVHISSDPNGSIVHKRDFGSIFWA